MIRPPKSKTIRGFIAPIQAWLLSQKRCVGCGNPLSKGISKKVKNNDTVICQCGRIYVHDIKKDTYRRALFNEI